MLVAILEKYNIKYYIYVKKELNTYTYYGYSEKNNIRENLSDNDIEFFKDYILNLDNIKLEDTYKVHLTNDKKLLENLKNNDKNLFNQLLTKKYSGLSLTVFGLILSLTLITSIISLKLLEKNNNLINEVTKLKNDIYSGRIFTSNDVYGGEFESSTIRELINSSQNLNNEEKQYLINDVFFDFIDDYIDESIVYNRLKDIDIIDFTDEEKINRDKYNTGYYNYTKPNILHVRDYEEDDTLKTMSTNSHEHIHQYQGNYEYSYIVEGTCSLLNKEFYTSSSQSYPDEQKRLKVLMEIIGTEPILKYIGGNFSEIEEAFDKYLTKSDAERLKSLFKTEPSSENIDIVHKEIDELLGKLYKSKFDNDVKEDEIINAIYNDLVLSRNYFNITNINDLIFEIMPNTSSMKKGYFDFRKEDNIKLECCSFNEMYGDPYYFIFNKLESKLISDEEYKILSLTNPNSKFYITEEYTFLYSYLERADGTYLFAVPENNDENKITTVNVTLEEAIELGYIKVKRYYNSKIKSSTRQHNNDLYNRIIFKDDYFLYNYNDSYVIARIKTIPTIKEKFETSNVKKLVKE